MTKEHDQAWRADRLARIERHPNFAAIYKRRGNIAIEQALAAQWLAEAAKGAGVGEEGRGALNTRMWVLYEGSASITPWEAAEAAWDEHQRGGVEVADA